MFRLVNVCGCRDFEFIIGGPGYNPFSDVNHDGVVDILDLVKILIAYYSDPTSPTWNTNCDLNGDQFIDIEDLTIAASHFGETFN